MQQGPRMSDRQFFLEELDLTRPALAAVQEAAVSEDWPRARREFAGWIRSHLDTERFLAIPYEVAENQYTFSGESDRQAADRICRNHMISCGTAHEFGDTIDWFANPTYNQYKEWTWQLSRHNEWKLVALVYNETKDERYADCVARQFQSWVRQALCPEPCPGNETLCWRTIEGGIRMGANWPYVLHSFCHSPAFTDDILIDWYKSVCEHGYRLQNHHWRANWLIMEMNGLAQIGILYPMFRRSAEWIAFAFRHLEEQLELQFYADGFQYELSTGYHDVVVNNYQRLIQVAQAYGVPLPDSFWATLEKASLINVKLMMPDGRLPDINDGFRRPISEVLEPKLRIFPENPLIRWAVSKGTAGTAPEFTSIALPNSGFLIMRESWEPDAIWALFDAAPFGRAHQHEDKLSLLLHAKGRPLIIEAGNYAYDTSEMRRYVLSTRAHNTMRVDGMDQNRLQNYQWHDEDITKPSGMEYAIRPTHDFAEAVYDEGYGESVDRSIAHRRAVYFLKQPAEGLEPFLLVVDRVSAPEEHAYGFLWHLEDAQVSCRPGMVQSENLTMLHTAPDSGFSLVRGAEIPEWQGWVSTASMQGAYRPVHTLEITVKEAETRLVTILYPQPHCPVMAVEATADPADTTITLQMQDGRRILLNEQDYRA